MAAHPQHDEPAAVRPAPPVATLGAARIPALGLGTWQLTGAAGARTVCRALELGFRHVDSAQGYANEEAVGEGLRRSGVPREHVFLTTKIAGEALEPAAVPAAVDASRRRLGVAWIDAVLIHWPRRDLPVERTVEALARKRASGAVRHLGVSNFPVALVDRARRVHPVACNQVELHPYLGQQALLDAMRAREVPVIAYSPLAHGAATSDPVIVAIAEELDASPARVVLRWLLDHPGVGAIPKAGRADHLRDDLGASSLVLEDAQRRRIDALACGRRLFDPPYAPRWDPVT